MGHDHEHCNRNVEESHKWNNLLCNPRDLLSAAADAYKEQDRKHSADDPLCKILMLRISRNYPERIRNVKGRNQIKANHVGQDHKYCEQDPKPVLSDRLIDIVGRAAIASAVIGTAFVDLSQSSLHESSGHSQKRCKPHPE